MYACYKAKLKPRLPQSNPAAPKPLKYQFPDLGNPKRP